MLTRIQILALNLKWATLNIKLPKIKTEETESEVDCGSCLRKWNSQIDGKLGEYKHSENTKFDI